MIASTWQDPDAVLRFLAGVVNLGWPIVVAIFVLLAWRIWCNRNIPPKS